MHVGVLSDVNCPSTKFDKKQGVGGLGFLGESTESLLVYMMLIDS